MIELFESAKTGEVDFWHAPSVVNNTVDVMISPSYASKFEKFLKEHGYPFHIAIQDLKKNAFFSVFHYYNEQKCQIAQAIPDLAKVVDIGLSSEGRSIIGIKFGEDKPYKKVVVIDAGIHAREWAAIHTGIYFINMIVNNRQDDPKIVSYLDNLVIYIFPVLNPDGYEYSRSNMTDPRARMWRKSRSAKACAFDGTSNGCCRGVDLNRNFDFHFAGRLNRILLVKVSYPLAFSNLLLSLKGRLQGYITLHTYSQLWIYSYSHRRLAYAHDIDETKRIAKKAVDELQKMYGTKYRYGTGPEIIYPFSGGSTDWAKETLKVKYSYTIELRPNYQDWNGFVLDKDQLIPTAKETWAGVSVVLDEILKQYKTNRCTFTFYECI
uniref:Peptidase_M14 domain-containing protein n=1 Tax=Angiostrongylus cantonensis TaxID=6313 RepID=A0A0K0CWH0_ANGCA